MTKKQIFILIALTLLTIAMILCALVMRYLNNQVEIYDLSSTTEEEFSSVVQTLAATEEITYLTTRADNGQQFTFVKENGNWVYKDAPEFPISEKVTQLIDKLASLKSSYTIWQGETLDMYGLESPVASITYGNKNNEEMLLIGKTGVMDIDEYCYAKLSNSNTVYVLESSISDLARQDIYGWVNVVKPPVLSASSIESVTIEMDGYAPLDLSVKKENVTMSHGTTTSWQWYNGDTNVTDSLSITSFTDEIRSMTFDGAVVLDPTAEELEQYGFSDPSMVFTVRFIDGKDDYVLTVGNAFKREESERDFFYCMTNTDENVYYMKDFNFDALVNLVKEGIK